jgi:hypothetical protein
MTSYPATYFVLTGILVLILVTSLLCILDLPCSPLPGVSDATHVGTVDMVVSWTGLPTLERQQTRQQYLSELRHADSGPNTAPVDTIDIRPERFGYSDELPILIRRAFVYGSCWIRNLHIVMPDECDHPEDIIREALGDMYDPLHLRVRVHRDSSILPRDALPCFSGHPKEANLDRIPGLSEQFVYANDDMFLNRPIPSDFFFSTDGRPRYRPGVGLACMDQDRNRACVGQHGSESYDHIQHNTAALFWSAADKIQSTSAPSFTWLEHQMKPLTRSGYRRARIMFPDAFDKLTHSHCRSSDDFSPTILIPNLDLASDLATLVTNYSCSALGCIELSQFPILQRNFLVLSGGLRYGHLLCVNNGIEDWHTAWISKNFHLPSSWMQ